MMKDKVFARLKGLIFEKNERSKKANINIMFMLLFRGMNILISLLYVPLLINSLTSYKYGIWLTITSIVAWLNLFDIGLGNGLRNKLSEAFVDNDNLKGRILISTSYFSISVLSIFFIFLFFIALPFIDWTAILNVDATLRNEVTMTVSVVFVLFCFSFVLNIVNSILLAFQRPAFSSLMVLIGQLLAFLIVFYLVKVQHINDLPILGFVISFVPVAVLSTFTIIFFNKNRYLRPNFRFIKLSYLRELLSLGIKFFIIQIITIILFQTCNIIIAQKINQEAVTNYNIIYKYIGVIYMIYSIIVNPYWSASTEAYARGDTDWIKKSVKKLTYIRYTFILGGILMILFSQMVFKIWIRNDSVKIQNLTLLLGLIYFVLLMKYNVNAYILNGIGKIYVQLLVTSVVAVVFIPLTIFMADTYGLNGIFLSLIFTALINVVWSSIQYEKIINNKATGIWIK